MAFVEGYWRTNPRTGEREYVSPHERVDGATGDAAAVAGPSSEGASATGGVAAADPMVFGNATKMNHSNLDVAARQGVRAAIDGPVMAELDLDVDDVDPPVVEDEVYGSFHETRDLEEAARYDGRLEPLVEALQALREEHSAAPRELQVTRGERFAQGTLGAFVEAGGPGGVYPHPPRVIAAGTIAERWADLEVGIDVSRAHERPRWALYRITNRDGDDSPFAADAVRNIAEILS